MYESEHDAEAIGSIFLLRHIKPIKLERQSCCIMRFVDYSLLQCMCCSFRWINNSLLVLISRNRVKVNVYDSTMCH